VEKSPGRITATPSIHGPDSVFCFWVLATVGEIRDATACSPVSLAAVKTCISFARGCLALLEGVVALDLGVFPGSEGGSRGKTGTK